MGLTPGPISIESKWARRFFWFAHQIGGGTYHFPYRQVAA